jgi:CRP/FNR family transcriptional regulator, dissimilatory nitrate respiration regulator
MINIISKVPFLSGLPDETIEKILNISVKREFNKSEIIFSEGDDSDGFYVLIKGLVKIFKVSFDGKEQILHFIREGEPFAEVPVFSGKTFPASAQAIKKSEVLIFPKALFVKLISEDPFIAMSMLAVLAKRLREFAVQVEELSLKRVSERLASYILYASDKKGDKNNIKLDISKTDLSSLLGTLPETLSRILNKMSSDGLIKVDGRTFTILNKKELENIAFQKIGD